MLASKRNGTLYKECKRAWKLRLIEEGNPDWKDLSEELY